MDYKAKKIYNHLLDLLNSRIPKAYSPKHAKLYFEIVFEVWISDQFFDIDIY